MAQVCFTGWRPGFDKVRFNQLLRQTLGLSLSEARALVDAVLSNERVLVTTSTAEEAGDLLEAATALGVLGEVIPG